jgi:hypothetical protein
MKKYMIQCLQCKQKDEVIIDKANRLLWDDPKSIISGRFRLDDNWGWQCLCGNNSLLTQQEDKFITDKVNPDPVEISDIVKNLVLDKNAKFKMEMA